MKRYLSQRHRGTEGYGAYLIEKNQIAHNTKEKPAIAHLKKTDAAAILFHHRNPTSTKNKRRACHPFSTHDFFDTNYVLVHNGVVSNTWMLQQKHEKLGIKYISEQPAETPNSTYKRFNDSEALLWEVALMLEGKQKTIEATGSIAFICIARKKSKDGKHEQVIMHFGRGSNPLKVIHKKNILAIASEGEGWEAKPNTLYTYNYATDKILNSKLDIGTTHGGYGTPPSSPSKGDSSKRTGTPDLPKPPKDNFGDTSWRKKRNNPTFGSAVATEDLRRSQGILPLPPSERIPYRSEASTSESNFELLAKGGQTSKVLPKRPSFSLNSMERAAVRSVLADTKGAENGGRLLDRKLVEMLRDYLLAANGVYDEANRLVEEDLDTMKAATSGHEEEILVLESVQDDLFNLDEWEDEYSYDTLYVTDWEKIGDLESDKEMAKRIDEIDENDSENRPIGFGKYPYAD